MGQRTCKNLCVRDKIVRTHPNAKRCTLCAIYLNYDGVRCPCCKTVLRRRIRPSVKNIGLKRALRAKREGNSCQHDASISV